MIAIDSSAVITIVAREPGFEKYVETVALGTVRLFSAGNYLECAMVLTRLTGHHVRLDEWIDHFNVEVVPVDLAQARLAADAFRRFGRGRHTARLNYGNCFAYALASSRGAPLLYKGTDSAKRIFRRPSPHHRDQHGVGFRPRPHCRSPIRRLLSRSVRPI